MFAEPPRWVTEPPVAPPEPERRPTWRGRDLLFGFGVLLLGLVGISVAVALLVEPPEGEFRPEDFVVEGVSFTVAFELVLAATVLLLALRRGMSLRDLGFVRPRRWGPMVVAVIGTYVALGFYALALGLLESAGVDIGVLDEGNTIPVDRSEETAVYVLLGVAVVLVAPFAEELFFRSFVFRAMLTMWPAWVALFLSGLAFSLFHINVSVIIPFTVVGMLFAWAYRASGSIWTSIGAHAIVNGISFVLTVTQTTA
ncbi:MAG: CPBP family intramembrane metalloprotease [Dehalococcoidia bacterium]|nr:CPBP family intramembrane metalloprotease [Dehalococcoidia bacterium]